MNGNSNIISPQEIDAAVDWQKQEKARQEYEGYCNKITTALQNLDVKNGGVRALWELIQNARDLSDEANIKIELTDSSLTFSHHGEPFDYNSLRSLVKQDSSKTRDDESTAGLFGTGFMTTHVFNRLVYVSGPFAVKTKDKILGYARINDFELDRTLVDTPEGPGKMKDQLKDVEEFCKGEVSSDIGEDDMTSFRYDLKPGQVDEISEQLSQATRLMPFVLIINSKIHAIEIDNQHTNEHFTLINDGEKSSSDFGKEGWVEVKKYVRRITYKPDSICEHNVFSCKSLQSNKGDVIIIPPFPKSCGDVTEIPSLFVWFPLIGTEQFGVNFIFHSERFYPVEKRDNIMLPSLNPMTEKKGDADSTVLKEMFDALFDYFAVEENAKTLTREMCNVSFPTNYDDADTKEFYEDVQDLWKNEIPDWKVLPISDGYYAVSDKNVKLLHPDFYLRLKPEQKTQYENVIAQYALLPKNKDDESYLMPEIDLIAWSDTVNQWQCDRDDEFYITVDDVCKAVQANRKDLHSFLMAMHDSNNDRVMDEYQLLPNREGQLHTADELRDADFMTQEVYDLVKDVMGSDSTKIYDTSFRDVRKVSLYTTDDLQRAITSTIGSWRERTLGDKEQKPLEDNELSALVRFCSATCHDEFSNARGRLMPLLAQFYEVEYQTVKTIKFKDDDEENFYSTAYNFLLDYTLYQISQKDTEWVKQNKTWLLEFLNGYSPSTNVTRKNRLNDYKVLPNQIGVLCLMEDLKKNNGVPEDLSKFYLDVFNVDLHESWVDEDFDNLIDFAKQNPEDIAAEIERDLVDDMKEEHSDRKHETTVRDIILKIEDENDTEDWQKWFGRINEKKAEFTFSMKTGDAQKSLFKLMDIDDDNLKRLAKIGDKIDRWLDVVERIQERVSDEMARFNHMHAIGKHIEDVLREKIESGLVMVVNPEHGADQTMTEDMQDGQDIVVKVRIGDEWKDVYYIEVKSKWNFTEPAHMSSRQIRKAVNNPDAYALCCVDLRNHSNEDLSNLSPDTIIGCTHVKTDIGNSLSPMVRDILEADRRSDDVQIKISEYRSNMGVKVFNEGDSMDALLNKIESAIKQAIDKK